MGLGGTWGQLRLPKFRPGVDLSLTCTGENWGTCLNSWSLQTPTLLPLLEHPRMIIAAATQIPLDTMQQQIGLIYLKQLDISEIFRQNCWTPIHPFQSSITNTLPPSWSHPSTKARWSIPSKPPSFETCVQRFRLWMGASYNWQGTISVRPWQQSGPTGMLGFPWISHIQIQGRKMTSKFDSPWSLLTVHHCAHCGVDLYLAEHSAECFPLCAWYHWVD